MSVQFSSPGLEGPVLSGVRVRLQRDAWLYYTVLGYTLFGMLFLLAAGDLSGSSHAVYIGPAIKGFLIVMPLVALGYDASRVVLRVDHRRRLAFSRVLTPERFASLAAGMILMAGITVFQGTFTTIKTALPQLWGGFPHDRVQADIDAMLFLGTDPWRLFQAVGGNWVVRTLVEFNYNVIWFALCYGLLFFVATSPLADGVRTRYLAMFLFTWIVCGNILAGLFLSAGPAFYGEVTGDHLRFADQLAFLAESQWRHSAAFYQSYLWGLYESGRPGIGSGISAFPSVHVALVMMNALFAFEVSRRWGLAALAYVALVLASSVYLGWHYAIDGLASIAVVTAGHFALRRLLCRAGGGTNA
ncbi:phosphatase PAP2 family protein [Hoeflea sp.]|uniref:phosphatase PAP2 family protein n=1 Tax=Hoeflea sp. TaxID=1940281 RepID=UPI003BAED4A5